MYLTIAAAGDRPCLDDCRYHLSAIAGWIMSILAESILNIT
ncbi:hypothetical protein [Chamaesiphon sp. VAR_69_metabat_338]|nr:hypothetical protein [Chamaesiphon sp. VAR_69_metabat_338]